MSIAAYGILLYVLINLGISLYQTYRDYKKGIDITMMHIMFNVLFGWWYTVPSMVYSWAMDKFERTVNMWDRKVIFRSK